MFEPAQAQQENLYAVFFMQPVRQGYLSEKEGRDIYKEEVFIRIKSPGDNLTEVVREASEIDKKRFAHQWAYFQQSQDGECETGTPLAEWAACPRSMVEEFRAKGYKNVESIANASDSQMQQIMGGYGWRTKAQAFLKQAADSSYAQQQASENEHLKSMIADLQEQIKAISKEAEKPRRGRPAADKED
jgi:hypothetical protein